MLYVYMCIYIYLYIYIYIYIYMNINLVQVHILACEHLLNKSECLSSWANARLCSAITAHCLHATK